MAVDIVNKGNSNVMINLIITLKMWIIN